MEKTQPIRLVIAHPRPIFRDGLRRLLERDQNHKVIGEASDGTEAVKLARQLRPDILLMDLIRMPKHKHPGLEALRELNTPANMAQVRVILLAATMVKSEIVEAFQLGARGVVSFGDGFIQVLLRAIQTVMAGKYWVLRKPLSNPELYLRILMLLAHEEARQKRPRITPRLLFKFLCQHWLVGVSNQQIAELLQRQ